MKQKTDIRVLETGWWQRERESTDATVLEITKPYPTPFNSKQFYTPLEIAKSLVLTVDTVYEYINSGELEAQPMKKGYRVAGSKANEMLARWQMGKRKWKRRKK